VADSFPFYVNFFSTLVLSVELRTAVSIARPSKCTWLLADSACAQDDDDDEQYADIVSEEEVTDTPLEDPPSSEGNDGCHKFPSAKAIMHHFVGEQNGLNRTATSSISKNS
jgi:hypothetical protein